MTVDVVVIGAGGFGREALDVLEAMQSSSPGLLRIVGVVDDGPSARNTQLLQERSISLLGSLNVLEELPLETTYLIGIGSPSIRALVSTRMQRQDRDAFTAIHPTAVIGSRVMLGAGSVICAGVQVSTNVRFGAHSHLNAASVIGHDSVLDDFVSVNPAAVISGDVHIGSETLIGAGATILQGLDVGARVVVGAAACVVSDVEPGRIVRGVPAR